SPDPRYSEEFNEGAWRVLRDHLGPSLLGAGRIDAAGLHTATAWVRGHRMAKAALEMAFLDAWLREREESLASFLGAVGERIPCGLSVGIAASVDSLVDRVAGYVEAGYRRVEREIEAGWG